jgi:hypothetical protein
MTWKQIIIQITEGIENIPSPFAKDGIIEHYYVVVNEEERMGFLVAWCSVTHKGIHFSRVKVPQGLPYILNEEFMKMKIPEIIWMDPDLG